jgi:hypothetical protein
MIGVGNTTNRGQWDFGQAVLVNALYIHTACLPMVPDDTDVVSCNASIGASVNKGGSGAVPG